MVSDLAQEQIELNYGEAKKYYMDNINKYQLSGGSLCSKDSIACSMKELNDEKIKSNEVMIKNQDGIPKLFLKRSKPPLEVISFEEAFDIILKKHIDFNHLNSEKLYQILKWKYSVPLLCVRLTIESCNVCQSRAQTVLVVTDKNKDVRARSVWCMNIILMSKIANDNLRYLLIYKNNKTNFLILRALSCYVEEVYVVLLGIFTEFGTPKKVFVPQNMGFIKDLFQSLYQLRFVKQQVLVEPLTEEIFEKDRFEVLAEMDIWKKKTMNFNWDVGCRVVQFEMNTTRKKINKIGTEEEVSGVPFELHFGFLANAKNNISLY